MDHSDRSRGGAKKRAAAPTEPDQNKIASKEKKPRKRKARVDWKWTLIVFLLSLVISVALGLLSSTLETLDLFYGFLILLFVIALGVAFDFIGIAVATADVGGFHSMASRGNPMGAKGAWLIKNANKVSSFCNDVIGDISGILSGAIGATIALKLFISESALGFWGNLIVTAAISAVTVGGKALFKGVALEYSQETVAFLSRVLCFFSFSGRTAQEKDRADAQEKKKKTDKDRT